MTTMPTPVEASETPKLSMVDQNSKLSQGSSRIPYFGTWNAPVSAMKLAFLSKSKYEGGSQMYSFTFAMSLEHRRRMKQGFMEKQEMADSRQGVPTATGCSFDSLVISRSSNIQLSSF